MELKQLHTRREAQNGGGGAFLKVCKEYIFQK